MLLVRKGQDIKEKQQIVVDLQAISPSLSEEVIVMLYIYILSQFPHMKYNKMYFYTSVK